MFVARRLISFANGVDFPMRTTKWDSVRECERRYLQQDIVRTRNFVNRHEVLLREELR